MKRKKQCKRKTMKEKTKTNIHVKDELHNDQSNTSKVLLKQPNQQCQKKSCLVSGNQLGENFVITYPPA